MPEIKTNINTLMSARGMDVASLGIRVRQFKSCQNVTNWYLKELVEGKHAPSITLAAAIMIALGQSVRSVKNVFPEVAEKENP